MTMSLDAELLHAFTISCVEQLANIEQHVLSLEQGKSASSIDAIFRAAHSIKADAATMGFVKIADLAHQAEDVLHQVRSGRIEVSRILIDALLQVFDCLRRMISRPIEAEDKDVSETFMLLKRFLATAQDFESRENTNPVCMENSAEPVRSADGPEPGLQLAQLTVPASKLDILVDQLGELAAFQARLTALSRQHRDLDALAEELERNLSCLRDQIMALRMVALKPMFAKFRRLVRDVAAQTGKQVSLTLTGEDTELDKTAMERLHAPLTHVLRNAVDHGIETPDERHALGKPRTGQIHVEARQMGADVEIVIRDDGRGVNREKLRQQALTRGIPLDHIQGQDDSLLELAFMPGLSTATCVSAYSGRGVGMDAAREEVRALRGDISLSSTPGEGTTVLIRLPLALVILDSLQIMIGDDSFFLQIANIEECLEVRRESVALRLGRGTLCVRGEMLPLVCLRTFFDMDAPATGLAPVLVVRSGDMRLGLIVDRIVGNRQIVLKKISRVLGRLDGILGSAVTEDGSLALVLDVPDIIRLCLLQASAACDQLKRTLNPVAQHRK